MISHIKVHNSAPLILQDGAGEVRLRVQSLKSTGTLDVTDAPDLPESSGEGKSIFRIISACSDLFLSSESVMYFYIHVITRYPFRFQLRNLPQ